MPKPTKFDLMRSNRAHRLLSEQRRIVRQLEDQVARDRAAHLEEVAFWERAVKSYARRAA